MLRATALVSLLVLALLACGQGEQADVPTPQAGTPAPPATPQAPAPAPTPMPAPPAPAPAPTPHASHSLFFGDTLVEQKILDNPVIVRATMTSFSSNFMPYEGDTFRATLEFNLTVIEYLKGTGPANIVAVWFDVSPFTTRAQAEVRKAHLLTQRDAQWDDREAIFFLVDGVSGFGSKYVLGFGNTYPGEDAYTLHSQENRKWLPAAVSASSASTATGDDKQFLLDVPSASEGTAVASSSSTTPTITLSALKKRIAAARGSRRPPVTL